MILCLLRYHTVYHILMKISLCRWEQRSSVKYDVDVGYYPTHWSFVAWTTIFTIFQHSKGDIFLSSGFDLLMLNFERKPALSPCFLPDHLSPRLFFLYVGCTIDGILNKISIKQRSLLIARKVIKTRNFEMSWYQTGSVVWDI